MAAINPVQGPMPSLPPIGGAKAGGANSPAGGSDFGRTLRSYIDQVDSTQQASSSAVQNLLSGKSQDVVPVVAAAAKADLSFKLLVGIRNKVIEAYKQTMNMQI